MPRLVATRSTNVVAKKEPAVATNTAKMYVNFAKVENKFRTRLLKLNSLANKRVKEAVEEKEHAERSMLMQNAISDDYIGQLLQELFQRKATIYSKNEALIAYREVLGKPARVLPRIIQNAKHGVLNHQDIKDLEAIYAAIASDEEGVIYQF